MTTRLGELALLGLLYVLLKWTLILSVGALAIEHGHAELLLAIPVVALLLSAFVRRRRQRRIPNPRSKVNP